MNAAKTPLSLTAPSSSGIGDGTAAHQPSSLAQTSPAVPLAVDSSSPPAKRRLKPPRATKVYQVAAAYLALKAQGLKLDAISETLKIPKMTIQTYVKRAHANGWFTQKDFDVEDQVEVSIPEKVVRNVGRMLDEGDKEMTIEAAKGLGIFKSHQAVKVDGQIGMGLALKVQVEMPPLREGQVPITVRPGSVGGTPALEGEVIGGES